MKQEFNSVVQRNSEGNLYVTLERSGTLYGSLMRAWLDVGGEKTDVRPHDLTTHLVVTLPSELVDRLDIKEGDNLEGTLESKDYAKPQTPIDLQEALAESGLDIDVLSLPQQRQGILFITEAKTEEIRAQRVKTMVMACQQATDAKTRQTNEPA